MKEIKKQYYDELERVSKLVDEAKKAGYRVPKDFVPDIPKNITAKDIEKLKNITDDTIKTLKKRNPRSSSKKPKAVTEVQQEFKIPEIEFEPLPYADRGEPAPSDSSALKFEQIKAMLQTFIVWPDKFKLQETRESLENGQYLIGIALNKAELNVENYSESDVEEIQDRVEEIYNLPSDAPASSIDSRITRIVEILNQGLLTAEEYQTIGIYEDFTDASDIPF